MQNFGIIETYKHLFPDYTKWLSMLTILADQTKNALRFCRE